MAFRSAELFEASAMSDGVFVAEGLQSSKLSSFTFMVHNVQVGTLISKKVTSQIEQSIK
jgi:hypothetical protein